MLEVISAAVAVAAAAVSTIQLLAAQRVSRNEMSSKAMMEFWAKDNRALRDTVWRLENKPFDQWSEDERWAADLVATQMSYIGLLLRHRYGSSDAFLNFYARWCVEAFRLLSPMVAEKRHDYGAKDQWIYFEWLARAAEIHLCSRPWWEKRSWQRLKSRTLTVPDPGRTP